MEAERAAGRLPPGEIAALAAVPANRSPCSADVPDAVARIARARAIFAASGAADPAGEWAAWAAEARSRR